MKLFPLNQRQSQYQANYVLNDIKRPISARRRSQEANAYWTILEMEISSLWIQLTTVAFHYVCQAPTTLITEANIIRCRASARYFI